MQNLWSWNGVMELLLKNPIYFPGYWPYQYRLFNNKQITSWCCSISELLCTLLRRGNWQILYNKINVKESGLQFKGKVAVLINYKTINCKACENNRSSRCKFSSYIRQGQHKMIYFSIQKVTKLWKGNWCTLTAPQ